MTNPWSWIALAFGHLMSVALVAGGAMLGRGMDRTLLQVVAALLLVAIIAAHRTGRAPCVARMPAKQAGLALWSFLVCTAHGAGLMLVPALLPLCLGQVPSGGILADGSLLTALVAMAAHAAVMIAATGAVGLGVCRAFAAQGQRRPAR